MHCSTACPHPLIFCLNLSPRFGKREVVDSFGTADAKAVEIKTNTSSGEVTILKLAPVSDSGNSTSSNFQAVKVSTQQGAMSVLLPNALLDSVEAWLPKSKPKCHEM